METQLDYEAKHPRGTGPRSFSIESLLSNNYKNGAGSKCHAQTVEPIHLRYEIDGLSKEGTWKEYFHQHDYLDVEKELSQKHLDLVRHIKNIDYLPWISTSNVLTQRELYEDSPSNRSTNLPESESSGFAPYSSLPLPFLYSSWLPVTGAVKTSEREETDLTYGYSRTTSPPGIENSDSDDSKSDCSKISDTPKDFSCPKLGPNGKRNTYCFKYTAFYSVVSKVKS